MKRIVLCVMAMGMLAAFTACSGNAAKDGGQTMTEERVLPSELSTETGSNAGDDGKTESATETATETATEAEASTETIPLEENTMKITAGSTTFTAVLADNSSAEALRGILVEGPLTIEMSDYASMEKVGPIEQSLVRNDEQISTEAGDIILYQGNSLVIYYDTNSWNFTRIGKIEGVTGEELLEAFGDGDVTVTFSLE